MPSIRPRGNVELEYYEAAQAYLKSLPPEHFMEAWAQGTQREIALASLCQVRRWLPRVHYFNEMLVQYRRRKGERLRQVVPDNLVVLYDGELTVEGSYDLELQPAGPFWTLEYVSKKNKRKDYDDNLERYEKELKVPYYLHFYPEDEELTLYRRGRSKYVSVKPDDNDRYAIEEIETEVGLEGGWVRFWFRGDLIALPDELQGKVESLQAQIAGKDAVIAGKDLALADKDAEIARMAAELARLRGG